MFSPCIIGTNNLIKFIEDATMVDISGLTEIEGFISGCLVDSDLVMAQNGDNNFYLDTAAAENTEVVFAKLKTMKALGITSGI